LSAIFILLFLGSESLFTVDASASASYSVSVPREALRSYLDDIGLFSRNMPGVVGVTLIDANRYLYRTERTVPLSPSLKTDFEVRKETHGDSLTIYRSTDENSFNYMACSVLIRPRDAGHTSIDIQLRVRLTRENASEIHWLAPLLGESLISRQMSIDLEEMLHDFIERSNEELYSHLKPQTASHDQ
jgi:hypothetical protein